MVGSINKSRKKISSKKKHESSRRRLANKRDVSLKEDYKTIHANYHSKGNRDSPPKLREDNSERNLSTKRKRDKDREVYNDKYKSESRKAYNEKSKNEKPSSHRHTNQTERGIRNAAGIQDNSLRIPSMPHSGVRDNSNGSHIYTFREQNKNEEYFKSQKTENTSNEMNDSDFINGYSSHNDISIDNAQAEKPNEQVLKKIIVQKNINFKGSFQKGKFRKTNDDMNLSPKAIKSIKVMGKENKD